MNYKYYIIYDKELKKFLFALKDGEQTYALITSNKIFITFDKNGNKVTLGYKTYKNLNSLLNKLVEINNYIRSNKSFYKVIPGYKIDQNYIIGKYILYAIDLNESIHKYLVISKSDTLYSLIKSTKENISQRNINLLDRV